MTSDVVGCIRHNKACRHWKSNTRAKKLDCGSSVQELLAAALVFSRQTKWVDQHGSEFNDSIMLLHAQLQVRSRLGLNGADRRPWADSLGRCIWRANFWPTCLFGNPPAAVSRMRIAAQSHIFLACLADMTRRNSRTNTHTSTNVGQCCSHVKASLLSKALTEKRDTAYSRLVLRIFPPSFLTGGALGAAYERREFVKVRVEAIS